MNGTTVSRRTLIQGAGAAAAVSMMPMGAAESEAAAAATAAIRDFDMIKAFYANYPKRMKAVRAAIKHHLTLTEKILFAHLYHPEDLRDFKRGADYVN